jgi:prepilin-type N-terminal cleavage/methylation domain-containing protein
MMKSKGFTLIELAVVLAIIAVLAAVLTPMVSGYIDQARTARAQGDVRTMADTIKLYKRDTGRWPIYNSSSDYPSTIAGGKNVIRTSQGSAATDASSGNSWNLGSAVATTSLESYLNNDYSSVGTSATFPKAAFRGPYIGTMDSDPWGHYYYFNAGQMVASGNPTNHAFVISSGPNGALDTNYALTIASGAATAASDDILAVIQ